MSGPGPAAAPGSSLLRSLRDSEAQRLELERRLMEYITSDAYLMKLRYTRLKKCLKEIDERQKRALLRNQAFWKEFDQLEARMKASTSAMIQKMEAWYRKEIKSTLSLQEGNLSAEGDKEEEYAKQMPQVGRQAGISLTTAVPRGLYHPATVFMGHHTSAVSASGGLGMWQKPLEPTESHLAPDLPLCSPPLEGLGAESGSSSSESDGAARHGDQANSEEGSEQLISSVPDPKPATEEGEQLQGSVPGPKPCLRTHKGANWEGSDELQVLESAEEVMLSTPNAPSAGGKRDRDACAAEGSPPEPPNHPVGQEGLLGTPALAGHGGMLAGLSIALQLIEDAVMRGPSHRVLYQGEHMGPAEPISFCNRAVGLGEDDLEACEAVVLHQLRALSQSVLNGWLLPEKTLDAESRAVAEKQTRPEQPQDMDMLWTHLSSHALFLKKHQVQLPEEVATMFESLLASSEEVPHGQALLMLREVLPEECEDRSPLQSNESSCGLPAIPSDSGEIKQANHTPQLASAGEQVCSHPEVTSWCGDESKEENVVKKIPVTGWDGGNDSAKAKPGQEMLRETSPSSTERSPPVSRSETRRRGTVTAIKSKAFWGESDDSSSELEAALRPRTQGTEDDEFDDFYD